MRKWHILLIFPCMVLADFEEFIEFEEFEEFEEILEVEDLENIDSIYSQWISAGSVVVDFGHTEETTEIFSRLVGPFGKVVQLDAPENLDEESLNIFAYPVDPDDVDFKIDDLALSQVALIKIDVWGNELEILDGAKELIQEQRPRILIKLLDGISDQSTDHYTQQHLAQRIHEVRRLGYEVSRLYGSVYLAESF